MARPKQRKPISTDVNDTLDDCYTDVPDDLLVSIVQISAGKSKLLTLTLYYTTGTIMLQGRACRKWVDQEFQRHRLAVNAIDKTGAVCKVSTHHWHCCACYR